MRSGKETDPAVESADVAAAAEPEPPADERLVDRPLFLAFVLVLFVGAGTVAYRVANTPPAFVGTWRLNEGAGALEYRFDKDRTGSVSADGRTAAIRWRREGESIVIVPAGDSDDLRFARTEAEWTVTKPETSETEVLTLEIGSERLRFVRELQAGESTSENGTNRSQATEGSDP